MDPEAKRHLMLFRLGSLNPTKPFYAKPFYAKDLRSFWGHQGDSRVQWGQPHYWDGGNGVLVEQTGPRGSVWNRVPLERLSAGISQIFGSVNYKTQVLWPKTWTCKWLAILLLQVVFTAFLNITFTIFNYFFMPAARLSVLWYCHGWICNDMFFNPGQDCSRRV